MDSTTIIIKVIKSKQLSNGSVKLVQLAGNNLFAVLTYNKLGKLINATCHHYDIEKKLSMKLLNNLYKKQVTLLYKI